MALIETSRRVGRRTNRGFYGTRIFHCPKTEVATHLASPLAHYASWPDDEIASGAITVTGEHADGKTKLTASAAIFTSAMLNWMVSITSLDGYFRVSDYTSSTEIKVYGDATCAEGKTFKLYNWFGACLQDTTIDYHWDGSESLVTAVYEPLPLDRFPGKGMLEVVFTEQANEMTWDLSTTPLLMNGEFFENGDRMRYRLLDSAMLGAGPIMLRLSVALTSLPVSLIQTLIGSVNDGNLPAFYPLGGAGKLLFHAPQARQIYQSDPLFASLSHIEFHLVYNEAGWNEGAVRVEKQKFTTYDMPVFNPQTNEPTGATNPVLGWYSLDPPVFENRVVARAENWSALNGFLL